MKFFQWLNIPDSQVSHNAKIKKKVLLKANEVPNIMQLAQAVLPAGEIADGHRHHDMTEVFMVVEGTGEMQINDDVMTIAPSDTVVVEAGDYHELRNTSELPLTVNYFAVVAKV